MRVMTVSIDFTVDVTDAAGLGEPLTTAVTVTVPDGRDRDAGDTRPIVCFGFPGGGYSRQYFTFDMPGASGGGQAGWHAARGWVFVSCDHLFVGESSAPTEPEKLTFEVVAAANAATVENVLARLAGGVVLDGFPALRDPIAIGIGQSMGGCFTIVQQARHSSYAGVGILGFSGLQTALAFPPGSDPPANPFEIRGDGLPAATWVFHYDDEPADVVAQDMTGYPLRERPPVWGSATVPPCAAQMLDEGVVAREAAAITVPVFVGVGERDVCPDPRAEPTAYASSPDITVFVCPLMSHMHNFASTRELFWTRLHAWGETVARSR
jgi:pimeloyl-ACP methyl ester carboxylesterase